MIYAVKKPTYEGCRVMCVWGTEKIIHVIRRNNDSIPDGWHAMAVDACIADYVQRMNDLGIITTGCCCGHGKDSAHVLIAPETLALATQHGYTSEPYRAWNNIHYIESAVHAQ